MPSRRGTSADDQPFLFDDAVRPAVVTDATRALATRLPPFIHLGTSSWSFPGWRGIVYADHHPEQVLARRGLAAYSQHPLLRTVGIDRAFYAPLRESEFAAYANDVPTGFRFLTKTYERLLRPFERDGSPNPLFLDAQYMIDQVIAPVALGLRDRAGPILLQLTPLNLSLLATDARRTRADGVKRLLERLATFLSALPSPRASDHWFLSLELRNSELLCADYAALLRSHGVAHCFNVHPTMPEPSRQHALLESFGGDASPDVVCRWMLHPSQTYEPAKDRYAPFTQIVDADDRARDQFASLVLRGKARSRAAFVIINKKAEGSAPRSVERLAEAMTSVC